MMCHEDLSCLFGMVIDYIKHEKTGKKLEPITFEILAAGRLRLMRFDIRLIIDCFSNVVIILVWYIFFYK